MEHPTHPGQDRAERERLRARIEQWLATHDPAMLARLRHDRWGERALTAAAVAIARNLARAETARADPDSADPAKGDEFYLMDHPEGLESAMVAGLAGDRVYWEGKLRWLPALETDPGEGEDETVGPLG